MRGRPTSRARTHLPALALVVALAGALGMGTAACGSGPAAAPATKHPAASSTLAKRHRTTRDPETAAALLRIARAFNNDYAANRDGPVYARWDAASQAIISRRQYLHRHRQCPSGPGAPVDTWGVAHGPGGAWLVHYSIGGIQFTDYWYYVHGRFVFDLPQSNPSAVTLYRLSPAQYVKAIGCNH